jgi:hypothetical protein
MKATIKNLLELLKELIPEKNPERQTYNNLRLIPIPSKSNQERRMPNPYNSNR